MRVSELLPKVRWMRGVPLVCLMSWSCGGDEGPAEVEQPSTPNPQQPVNPAPQPPVASSAVVVSSARQDELRDGRVAFVAWVSAPPASFPRVEAVTLRNVTRNTSLSTAGIEGGFDPVALEARLGDRIDIVAKDSAGQVTRTRADVRERVPVRVVRVSPGTRTDVPLNARIEIVFSAPVREQSVRDGLRLTLAGAAVPGTVSLSPLDQLKAIFVTEQMLSPNATYKLVVSQEVTADDGLPISSAVEVEFTTVAADAGPAPVAAIRLERRGGVPAGTEPWALKTGASFEAEAYALGINGTPLQVTVSFENVPSDRVRMEAVPTGGATSVIRVTGLLPGASEIRMQAGGLTRVQEVEVVQDAQAPIASIAVEAEGGTLQPGKWRLVAGERAVLYAQAVAGTGGNLPGTVTFSTGPDWLVGIDTTGPEAREGWHSARFVARSQGTGLLQLKVGEVSRQIEIQIDRGIQTTLNVWTSTTGNNLDPDGYVLQLNGSSIGDTALGRIPVNASQRFDFIGPQTGARLTIADVAPNCLVEPTTHDVLLFGNPQQIHFAIACGNYPEIAVYADGGTVIYRSDGSRRDIPGVAVSWSPDGSRVAYSRLPNQDALVVAMADGRSPRVVAEVPGGNVAYASWSPDGTRLAYSRVGPTDVWPALPIVVINADGTSARVIATGINPRWLADGQRLAYIAPDGSTWTVNRDGTGAQRIALVEAVISPDERRMALKMEQGLWVADIDGSNARLLVPGAIPYGDLVWSPDGSEIAYAAAVSCGQVLKAVPAAGGTPRNLAAEPEPGTGQFGPVWSPDGRWVAYVTSYNGIDCEAPGPYTVRIVASSGNGRSVFMAPGASPSWGPGR